MKKSTTYIMWSDDLNIGISKIDRQHKHFVGIMNELFEAIQTDKKSAVTKIIDELVAYADAHFALEEEYFEKYKYPDAEEHMAEHRKIEAKVVSFMGKKDMDQFELGYKLLDLLEEWLFHHIVTFDKKYIKFFKAQGIY